MLVLPRRPQRRAITTTRTRTTQMPTPTTTTTTTNTTIFTSMFFGYAAYMLDDAPTVLTIAQQGKCLCWRRRSCARHAWPMEMFLGPEFNGISFVDVPQWCLPFTLATDPNPMPYVRWRKNTGPTHTNWLEHSSLQDNIAPLLAIAQVIRA